MTTGCETGSLVPMSNRGLRRFGDAICGMSLIGFMAFAEVIPVASKVGSTPRFFTARLLLAPLWGQVRNLPSSVLAAPALVLLACALVPAFLSNRKQYLPTIPAWLRWALVAAGLAFFPIAASVRHASSIGPLWLLLFFTWLGSNLLAGSVDYFWSSVLAAFFWDMGAGVQGLYRHLAHLPEPYWNAAPPEVVVGVDVALILLASAMWVRAVDPGALAERFFRRSQDPDDSDPGSGVGPAGFEPATKGL